MQDATALCCTQLTLLRCSITAVKKIVLQSEEGDATKSAGKHCSGLAQAFRSQPGIQVIGASPLSF